jgi:hypothetical protein
MAPERELRRYVAQVSKKRLAEAHRLIGESEHGVAQRMLAQAESLPDPENMRTRAHDLSHTAERHLTQAARLDHESQEEGIAPETG